MSRIIALCLYLLLPLAVDLGTAINPEHGFVSSDHDEKYGCIIAVVQ